MLVLHGAWLAGITDPYEGRLALWAEDLEAFLGVLERQRSEGDRAAVGQASTTHGANIASHPYAATPEQLAVALRAFGVGSESLYLTGAAFLPAVNGIPLPSYELEQNLGKLVPASSLNNSALYQGQSSQGRIAAQLQQCALPVYVTPALEAVSILFKALASDVRANTGGIALADDLRFFAELARFAISCLSEGKVLPTLEPCAGAAGQRFVARWRLAVGRDDDVERYRLLVRSVPPVCRAFSIGTSGIESPTKALGRSEVVRGFLAVATDALVRAWLGDVSTDVAGGDAVSKWLGALRIPNPSLTVVSGDGASLPPAISRDSDGANISEASLPLEVSDEEAIALVKLCTATANWARSVSRDVSFSTFRTCFRLEPPENPTEDQDWKLRYFIVDEKDRSLLIPASTVWQEGGDILRYLSRRYERPRDTLLADLRRAAEVCPPIKRSLSESMFPEHCVLSPQLAYAFLKASSAILEGLGFVVLVPMIERVRQRPRVRLRIQSGDQASDGRFSLESLLTYDWRVALGDEVMDAAEFQHLVSLKTPLVSVRGKWIEVDPNQLWPVSSLLNELGEGGTLTTSRAICLSLAGGHEGYESEIEEVETDDQFRTILELLKRADSYAALEAPEGFRGQLRSYQAKGLSWLHFLTSHGFGACLADDMGLGKTIQLLALALHYKSTVPEKERRPILIVCPASVVYNWQRETERFAPSLRVLIYHGADRATGRAFATEVGRHDLVITTYALASRDGRLLAQINWSGVVLDEAQNIKNPATKQARSIKRLKADYRVALTGTPIENRLTELWSIMDFLNPGYLGSLKGFKSNYATPIERRRDSNRAERLRRVVRPFVLRRLKTDPAVIRDLPDKEEIKTYCSLTPEQATLYEAFVQSTLARVDEARGIERKGLILAMLTGLKQICNHPAHFLKDQSALDGRSGKLSRLIEMLDEVVSGGDSALVFTQFVEMGELLLRSVGQKLNCEVLFLHGGVPARKRADMVERFQSQEGGPAVFILSLRAGGTGLNLTTASRVFHYDRWWNPAVENQATDRAFRIGQRRNVQVYKFICRGTLEERIDALIDDKKALAESVIGSGEDWVTELTTEELRQLVALDGGAVIRE